MSELLHILIHTLDIAGIILLLFTIIPVRKLMHELPDTSVRESWKMLSIMIFFFLAAYTAIAVEFRIDEDFPNREIICIVLFLGALFVLMVSTLSLKTAQIIKRNYILEIENITDPLMDINNRRYLEQKLHEEFSKTERYGLSFSILMIDIDYFKKINDTYGHDVGDMVLRNLGRLIKKFIRDFDTVARYGGEEIMILCPLTDGQHATSLAQRLREEIEKSIIVPASMDKEGREIRITVSIGVAEYVPELPTIEALLKRADRAMYLAKHEGRNRVILYDGSSSDTMLS